MYAAYTLLIRCVGTGECHGPDWDRYIRAESADLFRTDLAGATGDGTERTVITVIAIETTDAGAVVSMCLEDFTVPVGGAPATEPTRVVSDLFFENVSDVGWRLYGWIGQRPVSLGEPCV